MNSNNPVLGRGFGQGQQHASWNAPAPAASDLQDMYNRPAYAPPARFMTLDDVVTKTAFTLGVVFLTAAAAWIFDLGGFVSGHTLKHLVAAAGVWCLVLKVRERATGPSQRQPAAGV